MIVTDIGISIGPYRSAFWDEIKSWKFVSYTGFRRVTLSRAAVGVSLHLFTDDWNLSQKPFSGSRGSSAFAEDGYYFDENQQEILQRIFEEHNIPKLQ